MSFFFIKFSIYAILLWMPLFLNTVLGYENHAIANILTLYEVATMTGTCILGSITDRMYGKRSPIAVLAIIMATCVSTYMTISYTDLSQTGLLVCMAFIGFFLGAIYHLLNTTCAADVGREQKGKTATATVTGIIDGCGSLGTGVGMISLGYFIDSWGY